MVHSRRWPHARDRSHRARAAKPSSAQTSARRPPVLRDLFTALAAPSYIRAVGRIPATVHTTPALPNHPAPKHPHGATPVLRNLSTALTAPSCIRAVGRMPVTVHTAPAPPDRSAPKHPHGATPVLRNLSTALTAPSYIRAVGRMPATVHTTPAPPNHPAPKHPHGTTPVLRNLSTTLHNAPVRRPHISHTYSQSYSSFSRLWLTAPPIV